MDNETQAKPPISSLMQVKQQVFIANATEQALKRLSDAKTDDVKAIAASQIELLSRFYDLSLSQASRSFRWALIASMIGLLFLLVALAFPVIDAQYDSLSDTAIIGSAISSFIAAVNFYLYGQTLSQLNLFQGRLEVTQRFLLANSLCESLGDDYKDPARARLIAKLSGYAPFADPVITDKPKRQHSGQRHDRDDRDDKESQRESKPEPNDNETNHRSRYAEPGEHPAAAR